MHHKESYANSSGNNKWCLSEHDDCIWLSGGQLSAPDKMIDKIYEMDPECDYDFNDTITISQQSKNKTYYLTYSMYSLYLHEYQGVKESSPNYHKDMLTRWIHEDDDCPQHHRGFTLRRRSKDKITVWQMPHSPYRRRTRTRESLYSCVNNLEILEKSIRGLEHATLASDRISNEIHEKIGILRTKPAFYNVCQYHDFMNQLKTIESSLKELHDRSESIESSLEDVNTILETRRTI